MFNPTIPTSDCSSLKEHKPSQRIPRNNSQKEMVEEFVTIHRTYKYSFLSRYPNVKYLFQRSGQQNLNGNKDSGLL